MVTWDQTAVRRDDVPVVIVMKAMGVESDQEVASLVGPEPGFAQLMLPSMEAASEAAVFTQQQALEWLSASPTCPLFRPTTHSFTLPESMCTDHRYAVLSIYHLLTLRGSFHLH